ncbi:MAG: HlyD family efflux transporter periplasmic adaptor subunit, partial [Pseudomonadota bacterium]
MRLLIKVLLPVLVLAVCVAAARSVIANRPEPQTRPQFKTTTSVEATRVKKSDYPVVLRTQGTVSAARQGSLVPQVAGAITRVSPNFVVGGEFSKDEVLLEIDPRDFDIAVTLAEATFAQSKAALAEEQARSDQAAADWKRLGRTGTPSPLTLRKPQLAAARASLEGARAQVERARLDLARSKITASYNGRIRAKHVDVGQYVNRGTNLAEIYATDKVEIRLPLSSHQLGFIDFDSA